MDVVTKKKWDRAAANFDLMAGYGPEKRWAPYKEAFFAKMGHGRVLCGRYDLGAGLRAHS